MKVVLPIDTTHLIALIPRYYTSDALVLELYNEVTQTKEIVPCIYIIQNGLMTITFDYDFIENDKFTIKISDSNGVIYRDKLISTSQTTQDFKSTKDLYYYE